MQLQRQLPSGYGGRATGPRACRMPPSPARRERRRHSFRRNSRRAKHSHPLAGASIHNRLVSDGGRVDLTPETRLSGEVENLAGGAGKGRGIDRGKRFAAEEIIGKLREAEIGLGAGSDGGAGVPHARGERADLLPLAPRVRRHEAVSRLGARSRPNVANARLYGLRSCEFTDQRLPALREQSALVGE